MRNVRCAYTALSLLGLFLSGCSAYDKRDDFTVPAEEYSRSVKEGTASEFSFHRIRARHDAESEQATAGEGFQRASMKAEAIPTEARATASAAQTMTEEQAKVGIRAQFSGDPRYTQQGYELKRTVDIPSPQYVVDEGAAPHGQYAPPYLPPPGQSPQSPLAALPKPPPGSSAPYHNGQMNSNPSLWPDEARGAYLFTDHRGYQPMDIITIVINERTKGKKKAETEAEDKYDLTAGISEFFGVETKKWAANNTSLDPANLITANTASKFEGDGETEREGTLNGQISAVILEVLPNNVMRIEGTKIVSLNDEEEVLVLSGLIRPRDINGQNQVDSSRVANMRIDFYGRGVIGENQSPGWGARIFQTIWPF